MAETLSCFGAPLKLRRDAVFLQTDRGIVFRSRKGSFAFQGSTIYRTFQQLLPHLQGTHTGDEVVAALRPESQKAMAALLRKLVDCDVLQAVDVEDAALLPAAVAREYSSQVEYIRHTSDRPGERFLRYRNSRVLLTGDEPALQSAGLALLRNGLAKLEVQDASPDTMAALAAEAERGAQAGVASGVHLWDGAELAEFDLVVFCSAEPDLRRLFALNAQAVAGRFQLLPAVVMHGSVVIGPLVRNGASACLQCAWLRWCDHLPMEQVAQLWRQISTGDRPAVDALRQTELQFRLLGNNAALEAFRLLVGDLGAESEGYLLVQTLSTFESARKPLLPHPACTTCRTATQDPSESLQEMSAQSCAQFWTRHTNEEFGVFSRFEDDTVEQLPLRVSLLAYPVEDEGGRTEAYAAGWDVDDVVESRLHAVQRALEHKGFLAAAPLLRTRMISTPEPWQAVVLPEQVEGWLGVSATRAPQTHLEGWDLGSNRPVLLPGAAVHPAFANGLFTRVPAAVGAGRDVDEATRRAVFSLAEARALDGVSLGTLALHDWTLAHEAESPRSTYLNSAYALRRSSTERTFVCEAVPGVFTALISQDGTSTAGEIFCGSGFNAASAVDEAVCERLAAEQLAAAGKIATMPPGRRAAFPGLGGLDFEPGQSAVRNVNADASLETALEHMVSAGYSLARVDVTPSDVVSTETLVLVKVVLFKLQAEGSR